MAQNLATKFSSKVSERLHSESIVSKVTNKNYDWVGVDTVKVYSVDTMEMNDYVRSGDNRYGMPTEIGDVKIARRIHRYSDWRAQARAKSANPVRGELSGRRRR